MNILYLAKTLSKFYNFRVEGNSYSNMFRDEDTETQRVISPQDSQAGVQTSAAEVSGAPCPSLLQCPTSPRVP